jgi:hypothetical protein
MKALQLFTEHSLKRSKQLGTDEILKFLEDFRLLHGAQESKSTTNPRPGEQAKETWSKFS